MSKKIIFFVLAILLAVFMIDTANAVRIADTKGFAFLQRDNTIGNTTYCITTDESVCSGDTPPSDRSTWEVPAGGSITLKFSTQVETGAAVGPNCNDAADKFNVSIFYETTFGTKVVDLYSGCQPPTNGTTWVFNATNNGSSTGFPRAGVVRIYMNATSFQTGVLVFSGDSDGSTYSGSVAMRGATGYIRSALNITNFTLYKDSAYSSAENKFMRGDTAYLELTTNAPAWGSTGVENAVLALEGPNQTLEKIVLNLTNTTGTTSYKQRTKWNIPITGDLNDYIVNLQIASATAAINGTYSDQFSDPGTDLTVNGVVQDIHPGIYNYRNIRIINGGVLNLNASGNLTLRADGFILVDSTSRINASGRGSSGGSGGVTSDCLTFTTTPGAGSGTGGGSAPTGVLGSVGSGGGGAGYGGSGGVGAGAGASTGGVGGNAFGSATDRSVNLGSGGAGGMPGCASENKANGGAGSAGGGIIILESDGNVTIQGRVEANGLKGQNGTRFQISSNTFVASGGGGGGSGGAVLINSSKTVITGTIEAKGGDGGDAERISSTQAGGPGGGGAGGRVKIFGKEYSSTGVILTTNGDGGIAYLGETNQISAEDGVRGTLHASAGVLWSNIQTTAFGYVSNESAVFGSVNFSDPDGEVDNRTAAFWVEDEFNLVHDSRPRVNGSTNVETNQYLQRGDVLNYSFVVYDEWGRTFVNKPLSARLNFSRSEPVNQWTTSTVLSANSVGSGSSIKVINSSHVYITFFNETGSSVVFGRSVNGGETWTFTRVDTGSDPTIDVVGATVFIAYYDSTNTQLKFAKSTNNGDTWTTSSIDNDGAVGEFASLDAVNATLLYVSYYSSIDALELTTDDLKIARSIDGGSTWSKTFAANTDDATGVRTSMSAFNGSHSYASYVDTLGSVLRVTKTTNGGDTWSDYVTVESGSSYYSTSIEAVGHNKAYLVYYDVSQDTLKFAKTTDFGSSWSIVNLTRIGSSDPSVAKSVSLSVLNNNSLFVSYHDTNGDDLKLLKSLDAGESWSYHTIDTIDTVGTNSDVGAVDNNTIYVLYYKTTGADLKFANSSIGGGYSSATTDSSGRLMGSFRIASDWNDSYHNTSPAQTETRNYSITVKFPYTSFSYLNGSFGENLTQIAMFDVDANYYPTITPNATAYSVGSIGNFSVRLANVRNDTVSATTVFNITNSNNGLEYQNDTYGTYYLYQFNTSSPNATWTLFENATGLNNTGTGSTTFTMNSTAPGVISQCANDSTDQCPQSQVNGTVYLKKVVNITNAGSAARTFLVESQCPANKDTWASEVCSTQTQSINAGSFATFTFKWARNGIVNATEGSWEVDPTQSSDTTTQHIRRMINLSNSDSTLSFSNLLLFTNMPTTGAGKSCKNNHYNASHCNVTFSSATSSNFYVNASGRWYAKLVGPTWEQDTSQQSTHQAQYIKKLVNVTSDPTGLVGLLNLSWSEVIEGSHASCSSPWNGTTVSGYVTVPAEGGWNTTNATGSGDCITETLFDWTQTGASGQNVSNQSISRNVQFTNLEDAFALNSISWSGASTVLTCITNFESTCIQHKNSGTVSIASGGMTNDTANATGDWIGNAFTEWEQNPLSTTVVGGTAYIRNNLTHNSTGGINFTNIGYTCNSRSSPVSWSGTSTGTIPRVNITGAVFDFACNVTADNVLNKTENNWTMNTTYENKVSQQYILRRIDITNRDPIVRFVGATWSTGVDGNVRTASQTLSGTVTMSPNETTSVNATGQGDFIDETFGDWVPNDDSEPEVGATGQRITRSLSAINNHSNITFTNVTTDIPVQTPALDWTCENSTGSSGAYYAKVNVTSGGSTNVTKARNCTSTASTVFAVGGFNWSQNTSIQSDVDGLFYIKGDINVSKNDSTIWTNIKYSSAYILSAVKRSNWNNCDVQNGTLNLSGAAGSFVTTSHNPVKCNNGSIVTKAASAEINTGVAAGKCLYRYQKWVNHTNTETISFTNVKTSSTLTNANGTRANITECAGTSVIVDPATGQATWNLTGLDPSSTITCLLNWSGNELKPAVVGTSNNTGGTRGGAPVKFTINVTDADSPGNNMNNRFIIKDNRSQIRDDATCVFTTNGTLQCSYTVPFLNNSLDVHLRDQDGEEAYWTVEGTAKDDTECPSDYFTHRFLVDRKGPRINGTVVANPASKLVNITNIFNLSIPIDDVNLSRVELWIKAVDKPGQPYNNTHNYTGGAGNVTFNINLTDLNRTFGTDTGTRIRWYVKLVDASGNERTSSIDDFFISCDNDRRFLRFKARPVSILSGQSITNANVTLKLIDKNNVSNVIDKETEVESDGTVLTSFCTDYGRTLISGNTYKLVIAVRTATETSYHIEDFTAP